MKICFVCQGNIIRSPLAENLFRHLIEERDLAGRYVLDSAGTSAYHVGEKPDSRMRQVARERGFEYTGSARQFSRDEFGNHDLIIAMDKANLRILKSWVKNPEDRKKIHLMREFDPQGGIDLDVPDPYYGGIDGFKTTYEIVERTCRALLEALEGDAGSD
jgi:protein-tyrosine phosphatase